MRGPKRNEGATVIGERSGTKAVAKHVRSSAYKARVVLDLIRGLDVVSADQVLQFTDRGIARDIRKVLASAVANATDTNNGAYIADAEELFVIACFADEGATLKRFRPRARGRASRIRKRTCHITVIVARMSEDRLEILQARAEGKRSNAAESRKDRVERSRKRANAAKQAVDAVDADEASEDSDDTVDTDETVDTDDTATDSDESSADTDVKAFADTTDEKADQKAGKKTDKKADKAAAKSDDTAGTAEDDKSADDTASGEFEAGKWAGSVLPDADGNGPESHPIKGNEDSMLYHVPGSRYYKITKAEVWFDTEAHAEEAGFTQPGQSSDDAGEESK